jgi:hypothetical protein
MSSPGGPAIKDGVVIEDALRGVVDWLEVSEKDESNSVV